MDKDLAKLKQKRKKKTLNKIKEEKKTHCNSTTKIQRIVNNYYEECNANIQKNLKKGTQV